MMEQNSKHFFKLAAEKYNVPNPVEGVKGGKQYVTWGEDNLWPQTAINLTEISTIHNACIQKKLEFALGQKITYTANNSFLSQVNEWGENIVDIYNKTVYDYIIYKEYAINVVWSRDGKSIASMEHVDMSRVRKGKKDPYGNILSYYVCADWSDTKRNKINEIPAFSKEDAIDMPSQLYVFSTYNPTQQYYAKPDYLAALAYIYLDFEIANFHISNIKNGFFPSLLLNLRTQTDSQDERDDIWTELVNQYKGSKNAGEVMVSFSPEGIDAQQIQANTNSELFVTLNNMVQQYILTAHRITSPMLLGIKSEGQLGGRTEIVDATELFLNGVIIPIQNQVIGGITKLLKVSDMSVDFNIEQVQPVANTMSDSLMEKVLTQDEIREMYGYEPLNTTQTEGDQSNG